MAGWVVLVLRGVLLCVTSGATRLESEGSGDGILVGMTESVGVGFCAVRIPMGFAWSSASFDASPWAGNALGVGCSATAGPAVFVSATSAILTGTSEKTIAPSGGSAAVSGKGSALGVTLEIDDSPASAFCPESVGLSPVASSSAKELPFSMLASAAAGWPVVWAGGAATGMGE